MVNIERYIEIVELRKQGYTYKEIGEKYNISGARAKQLHDRYAYMSQKYDRLAQLTLPTFRAIHRQGVETEDELIERLTSENGLGISHIGTKGIEELEKLVGFKISTKKVVASEYNIDSFYKFGLILKKIE